MQRIDGTTAAAALPAPAPLTGTPGYFTGGDPSVPTPPTVVPADWFNMIQEELAAVVLAAGLELDKANSHQLLAAITAMISSGGVALASDAEAVAGMLANKATSPHSAAALVANRITALIAGAPTALSTLKALADAIGNDTAFSATMLNALSQRVPTSRAINGQGLLKGGGALGADLVLSVPAATGADLAAGTAADRAVTPAAFAGVGAVTGNGSWTVLPGGFIFQWGQVSVPPGGISTAQTNINFPLPFPNACQSINGNSMDGPSGSWRPMTVMFPGGPGLASCAVLIDTTDGSHHINTPITVYWQAVGR